MKRLFVGKLIEYINSPYLTLDRVLSYINSTTEMKLDTHFEDHFRDDIRSNKMKVTDIYEAWFHLRDEGLLRDLESQSKRYLSERKIKGIIFQNDGGFKRK